MKKDLVKKAFREINRADFVLSGDKNKSEYDEPISIGYGQTISQPTTVRMMLEWLDAKRDEKVLDVGSGSGWTTALLSKIVGDKGKVFAVERILELMKFGEENCRKAGIKNAKFFLADENIFGLPAYAPFDRILVSAATDILPQELIDQLRIGGKIVIPVIDSVFEITKLSRTDIDEKEHYGFTFVPLIK